jgi:H/ACA ribonucleoprotein complex subunit 4
MKGKKTELGIDSSKWPLLLKNYHKLLIRTGIYTPISAGHSPTQRPIKEYISYGCINLDKPANPSTYEIVSWLKKILRVEKITHTETVDPKVTGNLILYIERANHLSKILNGMGKDYICVCKLHNQVLGGSISIVKALEKLNGAVFQRSPFCSFVKRQLHICTIYHTKLLEYDNKRNLLVFWINCETRTHLRAMCIHLGFILGVGGHMQELRNIRSGILGEKDNMVTMHDILDAMWLFDSFKDERYLRRVIMPLEVLLTKTKRLVIKDSSINAICYGATLMIPGLLRFEEFIDVGDEVVVMTTKGEAIGIGVSQMTTVMLITCDHGIVAKIKRLIMEKDIYPKRWRLII